MEKISSDENKEKYKFLPEIYHPFQKWFSEKNEGK